MLTETDRRQLAAFEIWTQRRMEQISWMDEIAKKDVLRKVN